MVERAGATVCFAVKLSPKLRVRQSQLGNHAGRAARRQAAGTPGHDSTPRPDPRDVQWAVD